VKTFRDLIFFNIRPCSTIVCLLMYITRVSVSYYQSIMYQIPNEATCNILPINGYHHPRDLYKIQRRKHILLSSWLCLPDCWQIFLPLPNSCCYTFLLIIVFCLGFLSAAHGVLLFTYDFEWPLTCCSRRWKPPLLDELVFRMIFPVEAASRKSF
jgi:hypothetical protein